MTKILFSRELHVRVKDYGITSYSLQPGVVNTELSRHSYRAFRISLMFSKLYGLTPIQGAQRHQFIVQLRNDWRNIQGVTFVTVE